jgi:hypothetical protein
MRILIRHQTLAFGEYMKNRAKMLTPVLTIAGVAAFGYWER